MKIRKKENRLSCVCQLDKILVILIFIIEYKNFGLLDIAIELGNLITQMINVPIVVLGNKSSPSWPRLHLSGPITWALSLREIDGPAVGPIFSASPVVLYGHMRTNSGPNQNPLLVGNG